MLFTFLRFVLRCPLLLFSPFWGGQEGPQQKSLPFGEGLRLYVIIKQLYPPNSKRFLSVFYVFIIIHCGTK
jgi:hypothetical protein